MFNLITNMQVSRRLLCAFSLAAIIPGIIISILGFISIHTQQSCAPQTNFTLLVTVVGFLSTVLIVTSIGYFVCLTITRPLYQLTLLARRVAQGETDARAGISGRDEFYLVANSMNSMLDNIVQLIQQAQDQRGELQDQVEKLVNQVSGVGKGDLDIQAEISSHTLGVLADSLNYMVKELNSLVVRIKTVANEVGSSTTGILTRMSQLVERGNIQLQQFAHAEQEVQQVVKFSHQVAERSQTLYEVARGVQHYAQSGRKAVQQVIGGMEYINNKVQATASNCQILEEHSRNIDEIIEVISNIAHQTNRLALDAAIQAAMTSKDGKAFGAVAADIRRLAEHSKDQTSVITRIVRSVREEISTVARSMQDTERESASETYLAKEAGLSLEAIFTAIEYQTQEVEHINQIAYRQLQSSHSVLQIMQSIMEYTRRSSKGMHDTSHNMERLVRVVEHLRTCVEAFKLRDNQQYVVPKTSITMPLNEDESPHTVTGGLPKVSTHSRPLRLSDESSSRNWPGLPPINDIDEINKTGQMRALKRQDAPRE